MSSTASDPATTEALARILAELNEMKLRNAQLESKVGWVPGGDCMHADGRRCVLAGGPAAWCCGSTVAVVAQPQALVVGPQSA